MYYWAQMGSTRHHHMHNINMICYAFLDMTDISVSLKCYYGYDLGTVLYWFAYNIVLDDVAEPMS